jgi:hypothetical protein
MASHYRYCKELGMTLIAMLLFIFPGVGRAEEPVWDGPHEGPGWMQLAHRGGRSDMQMCCNESRHQRDDHSSDFHDRGSGGDSQKDRDRTGHDGSHGWAHKSHDRHHRGFGWWKRMRAHRILEGVLMGGYIDQRQGDWAETAKTYDYHPEQGLVIKVETVRVDPEVIEPGKPSKLILNYSVLNPNAHENVAVKENRDIMTGDDLLKQIGPRLVERKSGTFSTEQEVTFPKDLPDGLYSLKGVVEAGDKTSSKESYFHISKIRTGSGYIYALSRY